MEENVGLKILPAEHQDMVEHLEQIHGLRISFAAWLRATDYLRKKTPEGNNEGVPPLRGMKDLLNDACNVLIHDYEEAVTEAENLLSQSLVYYSELVREKGRQSRLWCSYLLKELNYLEVKLLRSIDFSPPIIPASDALPPNSKDMISCCQKLVTALKLRQCDDVPSLLKEFDGCLQMFHIRLFKKLSKFCTVGIKHVDKVQSRVSGIPAPWLKRSLESMDITTFRRQLCGMVQGHDSVIDKIANALFSPVLASKEHRPWTFLFLGQSGTGMGQMAKAISTHLFCSQLIKLDMFEATLEKLMDSIRNKPYCLLHLKSFEKVSSSLMDSIITILTHGKLTDEDGFEVDFTKTMIIMTSNVGAHQLDIGCPLYSRNSKHSNNEHVCSTSCSAPARVLREAKKTFDSVMLNQLDGIHVFSKTYSEEFVISHIMREMTMLVTNNPIAIYPSECALHAVLSSVRSSTPNPSCRNRHALKGWLFENVYPAVESNYVNCNYKGLSAVYIDTLVGTNELCYRKELHGTLLEEFFLKKYSMSWRKLKATHMGEREAYKQVVILREKCSNPIVCIQIDEMAGYNQDFIRLLESFLQTLHSMLDISNESLPKQVSCRQLDEEEMRVLGRKSGYRLRGHNLALDIIMEAIFRSTKAITNLPLQPASTLLLLGFDSDSIMQILEGLLKELSFTRTLSVIHIDMSKDDFETRLFKASNPSAGGIGSVLPSIIYAVEAWPHCVIFFDKVEKAAPSDYSYLLRILDTGVLDSRGYMVDFRRAVIILNSDLGRKERIADIFSCPSLKTTMGDDVQQGEESRFRSELLGRVDEVVMANPSSSGREIARVDLKSDQLLRRSSIPTGVFCFFYHIFDKNLRSMRLGSFLEVLKFDLSVQIVKRPPLFLD